YRAGAAGSARRDRAQLDDHRGPHRDSGFQIGIGGRDRGLQDNKRPSPLAHGSYSTAAPAAIPWSNRTGCASVAGSADELAPVVPRWQAAGMRTYGQYCPIARSAELLAERWTMIILRNILVGCQTFNEIADGAP